MHNLVLRLSRLTLLGENCPIRFQLRFGRHQRMPICTNYWYSLHREIILMRVSDKFLTAIPKKMSFLKAT